MHMYMHVYQYSSTVHVSLGFFANATGKQVMKNQVSTWTWTKEPLIYCVCILSSNHWLMEYGYPIYKTQYKLIFTHTYIYQSGYIIPFKFEFVLNFHELHLIYVQWPKHSVTPKLFWCHQLPGNTFNIGYISSYFNLVKFCVLCN